MEELRVSKLLAGALAAVTAAAVASVVGFQGTLAGAALMSIFMAVTTALYSHSLAFAHGRVQRAMVRRTGRDPDPDEPRVRPIRWQRVAAAAAVAFVIALGAITMVEAGAGQPLSSLFWHRPRPQATTSIGAVATPERRPTPPSTETPAASTTSPGAVPPTTLAGVATTTMPPTTTPTTAARTATTAAPRPTQPPTTPRP
jgi:hypothetical protein